MIRKTLLFTASCLLVTQLTASDITAHLANLNSPDYEARQTARLDLRQTLVNASARDLKALERELIPAISADRDFATRDWSIRMLELVGTRAAVAPLAALLADPDPRIADLARRALSALPSGRADSVLEKAALAAAPADRAAYADALAYRDKPRARNELALMLADGSADAALALGKIASRSSRSALIKAHATADGELKTAIEFALIDAGLNDRNLARTLAASGQTDAIQVAAFEQLIDLDPAAAAEVLTAELADPAHVNRRVMLRMAMASSLNPDVVDLLATLPEADQAVVLGAIADFGLRQFEPEVLALLNNVSASLQPMVVRTLGHIGSDASYQPLLDLYLADDRDREVSAALARLQAPAADASLMTTAAGRGALSERVAALQLLVLRNTDGVTDLLNELGKSSYEPELREAAFQGMEIVGDTGSVDLLLNTILANDAVKRQAQSSLKKLSANLAIADYLWDASYAPAMAATANDDRRRDVLVILDGNSGPASTAYLKQLILTDHPLRADALRTLQRWNDISGGDIWLELVSRDDASQQTIDDAKRGIMRLLTSPRVFRNEASEVMLAKQALLAVPDHEFQTQVLGIFDGRIVWGLRRAILREFPELLNNPSITADVMGILEKAGYEPSE